MHTQTLDYIHWSHAGRHETPGNASRWDLIVSAYVYIVAVNILGLIQLTQILIDFSPSKNYSALCTLGCVYGKGRDKEKEH